MLTLLIANTKRTRAEAVRSLCLWHEQHSCSCGMRLVALYKCCMPL